MAKQEGYVTFIVHCPHCHQRLSAGISDGATTPYRHDNLSDCPEGSDTELPTVTVDQLAGLFAKKPAAKAKTAKKS